MNIFSDDFFPTIPHDIIPTAGNAIDRVDFTPTQSLSATQIDNLYPINITSTPRPTDQISSTVVSSIDLVI